MGTANSMNIMAEAPGMAVTDKALTPATSGARMAIARRAGRIVRQPGTRSIPGWPDRLGGGRRYDLDRHPGRDDRPGRISGYSREP